MKLQKDLQRQYSRDRIRLLSSRSELLDSVDHVQVRRGRSHSMEQQNSDTILKSLQTISGQLGALKQQVQRNEKIIRKHTIQTESLREDLASDDLSFPTEDGSEEPPPDASQSKRSKSRGGTKREDPSQKMLNQYRKRCSKVLSPSRLQSAVSTKPTKTRSKSKSQRSQRKSQFKAFVERNISK